MGGIALVTGASGGLALACARELAERGWRAVGVSRQPGAGDDWAEVLRADVGDPSGAREAVAACVERHGVPDLLLHCAGSTLVQPLHRTAGSDWREVMRANVDTAFFALQAWTGALRGARRAGAAVLVSSVVSRIGVANHEAIAAAKGAVEALGRSAAATYAADGIRVNVVAPGIMDTPLTAKLLGSDAMRAAITRQYPLARIAPPAELAALMCFLAIDAPHVTGQVIALDGGFSAVRPLVR